MVRVTMFFTIFAIAQHGVAQCLSLNTSGFGMPPMHVVSGTGMSQLDDDLRIEARRLENTFHVRADLQFIDDSGSHNAFASPEGNVYLGAYLMRAELRDQQGGPGALIGIEAHEFGHILQATRGSRLSGKQLELDADFLAGWYLYRQHSRKLDPWQFLRSVYNKGDFAFYDPSHHGTPKERADAMLAGYATGQMDIDKAFETGVRYVMTR